MTPSEMKKLEEGIDTLISFMISAEGCTVPKLEEWCKSFSEVFHKSKSVIAMADGRQIASEDPKAMHLLCQALAVKVG